MSPKLTLGDPVCLGEVGLATAPVSYPVEGREERIVRNLQSKRWQVRRAPDPRTGFASQDGDFATEHEALAALQAEVDQMPYKTIRWSPPEREPEDAPEWENVVAPIVGAGGHAVLVLHPDVGNWHVNEAYKGPKAMPVGAFGSVDTTRKNVRADVEAALKSAGKPVV